MSVSGCTYAYVLVVVSVYVCILYRLCAIEINWINSGFDKFAENK